MNYNEKFLYFNEDVNAVDSTGDGAMYKASTFLGADTTGAAEVTLSFASRNGAATDDIVAVTQTTSDVKLLMRQLSAVLSRKRSGFFTQSDNIASDGVRPAKSLSIPVGDAAESFITGVSGIVITTQA
jgi:hypothetical protein